MILAEQPFFGFQGEGASQGYNSLFIRFSGCNLYCSRCDSKFASREEEKFEIDFKKLQFNYLTHTNNIIFTGGEPLLYIDKIIDIIQLVPWKNFEIETNGTILPNEYDLLVLQSYEVVFNVSPKGNFKQDDPSIDTDPVLLNYLDKEKRIVKILFDNDKDFDYIKLIQDTYLIDNIDIYVQPKATTQKKVLKLIKKYYKIILDNKWNISSRLHVLLFNDERGV